MGPPERAVHLPIAFASRCRVKKNQKFIVLLTTYVLTPPPNIICRPQQQYSSLYLASVPAGAVHSELRYLHDAKGGEPPRLLRRVTLRRSQ